MTQTTQTTNNNDQNQTASIVDQLVGEGKKFSTIEDLAKGKLEADAFIPKLTNELAELRQIVAKQGEVIEAANAKAAILDRLNGTASAVTSTEPQTHAQTPETPAKGMSPEDVLALIETSKKTEAERLNATKVNDTLAKELGADAVAYVRQKADELGFTTKELMDLGKRNPTALFNMLGLSNTPKGTGNPAYRGSSQPLQTNATIRNQAYYDGLKKSMGTYKFVMDKNLQIQMHKDMQALGDAF